MGGLESSQGGHRHGELDLVVFIVIGFVVAALNGNVEAVTQAAFDGAKSGVTVCFGLISVLVFWMGMIRIAEDAGLLSKLARLLQPAVRFLFPSVPKTIRLSDISCRT